MRTFRTAEAAIVEARLHALLLSVGVSQPYTAHVSADPDGAVRVRLLLGRYFALLVVKPQAPVKPQLQRLVERLGGRAAAP